jgi:Flp pilus assembly protein TadG
MRKRIVQALGASDSGAAAIELALALPILSAAVLGMSDIARAYSLKLQIEQAAQRTVEQVEQEKYVLTSSYNTSLTTEATSAMSDLGYTSGNTITPNSWLECSSDSGATWTTQSSFTGSCPNATDITARYVSVKISRTYDPLFTVYNWPGSATVDGYAEVRIQ